MKSFAVCFAILFACEITANAWLRPFYEDEVIVQRSELIAIGHLKENSIQYVPHDTKPPEGRSWEHHAILVITEAIKGKSETNEIPIIIHYGLDPVVGGYVKRNDGFMINVRGNKKDYPTNLVQIFDTGNSMKGGGPVVEDASKDNIWFLRRLGGYLGREPASTNYFGILDPEDVQPLNLRKYFETYLSSDPKNAVKAYAAENPHVAGRSQRYLNHLEVGRILKIENPTNCFKALLPHYLNRESWDMKSEIRNGIISCGSVAGEKLISVFQDPNRKDFRQNIILIWRDMNYTNVAPMLIQLLKDHDQFWSEQKLTNGWWNADVGSELTKKRRDNYVEIYYSVCALRKFYDPQAKEVIELTKKRWEVIQFDNPQILEECNAALKELGN